MLVTSRGSAGWLGSGVDDVAGWLGSTAVIAVAVRLDRDLRPSVQKDVVWSARSRGERPHPSDRHDQAPDQRNVRLRRQMQMRAGRFRLAQKQRPRPSPADGSRFKPVLTRLSPPAKSGHCPNSQAHVSISSDPLPRRASDVSARNTQPESTRSDSPRNRGRMGREDWVGLKSTRIRIQGQVEPPTGLGLATTSVCPVVPLPTPHPNFAI